MSSVAQLTNLKWLSLEQTAVTDTGIAELEGLQQLETLLLNGITITDAALESLKKLKSLRLLDLTYCDELSQGAVNELRAALPNTQVSF